MLRSFLPYHWRVIIGVVLLASTGCTSDKQPSGETANEDKQGEAAAVQADEAGAEDAMAAAGDSNGEAAAGEESGGGLSATSETPIKLPDYCNTPDAMALLPDGSFLLSVPNFNDLEPGAMIMKITPDNQVEKFLDLPKHPVTGDPVGALGICVAPSGDLFLADFQMNGDRQSRVLRIRMKDGQPGDIEPVVTGLHVANAVKCHDGYLYVSETQLDVEAKPATSGVLRFALTELDNGPVKVEENEAEDPHFLGIILIHNEEVKFGADGLCFDAAGNLYIGNFADGTVHRFTFDEDGNVSSNEVFAKSDNMKCADGLIMDEKTGVIYVADSMLNAIQLVFPDGSVKTLSQNGDTDGLDGGMDQPCEALIRGDDVIVSNMDWPVPGCINQTYNPPATLSVIKRFQPEVAED
jgi:hypothetical protein